MANPLYGKNKDATGHHLIWDEGIMSHELLSRITPFLFEKISGFMNEHVSKKDCILIARNIRNWASTQKLWIHDIDKAFFRYGITTCMPPFIKKLEQNDDKIEAIIPGMKNKIREIYLYMNMSTFDPGRKTHDKDGGNDDDDDDDAGKMIEHMLDMATFFETCGGIIPEWKASDDDHRVDFASFMNEKGCTMPPERLVDAFIDEKVRPLVGDDPEYFDYIKKLVTRSWR
jgi:hypothetical protein